MEVRSLQQFFAIAGVSVSTQSYSASFQSFRFPLSVVIPIQRRRIERLDRSDFEMCRARSVFSLSLSLSLSLSFYIHIYIVGIVSGECEHDARLDLVPCKRALFPNENCYRYRNHSRKRRLSSVFRCRRGVWMINVRDESLREITRLPLGTRSPARGRHRDGFIGSRISMLKIIVARVILAFTSIR